jgi:hypothetical protein
MRIAQGFRALSPFNRVGLSFSPSAPPFAVDDIVYKTPPAIPEPGTLLLVRSGIEGSLASRRRLPTFYVTRIAKALRQ